FNVPTNAYYIRLTIPNDSLNTAQLNRGSTLLPYEPFFAPRFTEESGIRILDEASVESVVSERVTTETQRLESTGVNPKNRSVSSIKMQRAAVLPEHLSVLEQGTNLINKQTVLRGHAL